MSLSQDEINALLSGDSSEGGGKPAADAGAVEIMSPEAIEAMLEGKEPSADAAAEAGDVLVDHGNNELDDLFASFEKGADEDPSTEVKSLEGMLTPDEVDVLGEVGNMCMGAVATTLYSILDRRVEITTPRVNVYKTADVLAQYKIPFVVVTVEYIEGIIGNNLLVLKVPDAVLITGLMMGGGEGAAEETAELNEMHLSAMSEVMNQMMGASSTALSKLLRTSVNISTPKAVNVDVNGNVSHMLNNIELVTKVSFDMEIEGLLKSELLQLIPYDLSRELAKRFMSAGMGIPPAETAASEVQGTASVTVQAAQASGSAPVIQAYAAPSAAPYSAQMSAQQFASAVPYPAQHYPPPYPQYPSRVDVMPVQYQAFDNAGPGETGHGGIGLVQNIPLQVTVELGKAKKEISEILGFGTGTIVVLDKIAGDPVEIVVNGKLIARGEVVVIEENYGVRITDILNG